MKTPTSVTSTASKITVDADAVDAAFAGIAVPLPFIPAAPDSFLAGKADPNLSPVVALASLTADLAAHPPAGGEPDPAFYAANYPLAVAALGFVRDFLARAM